MSENRTDHAQLFGRFDHLPWRVVSVEEVEVQPLLHSSCRDCGTGIRMVCVQLCEECMRKRLA